VYACKSLVSSAHLAITQYYEKNGKSLEEVTGELMKLIECVKEFEQYYASCAMISDSSASQEHEHEGEKNK
jgi:hypothetical protein